MIGPPLAPLCDLRLCSAIGYTPPQHGVRAPLNKPVCHPRPIFPSLANTFLRPRLAACKSVLVVFSLTTLTAHKLHSGQRTFPSFMCRGY